MFNKIKMMILIIIEDIFINKLWDLPNKSHYIERKGKLTGRVMVKNSIGSWSYKYPIRGSSWVRKKDGKLFVVVGVGNRNVFNTYFNPPYVVIMDITGKLDRVIVYNWNTEMEQSITVLDISNINGDFNDY